METALIGGAPTRTHPPMLATLLLALVPVLVPGLAPAQQAFTTARFPSEDGLQITADLYKLDRKKDRPCIVLFHQARYSRGEYRTIAPRLVEMGYTCLAVDLRSGGGIGGASNETMQEALKAEKPFEYKDALPDVRAALRFARERYVDEGVPVIAWGSSYSASLSLLAVGEEPGLADGVLAFSPGEYFAAQGKPEDWIRTSAGKVKCPTFVTSAKKEQEAWAPIFEVIPAETKVSFLPEEDGRHGSSALWPQFKFSTEYWEAVESFLTETFPSRKPGQPASRPAGD